MNSFVRDSIIIIGRSEIVKEVANLNAISELFTTLAINNLNPNLHPTYTMFLDKNVQVLENIRENKISTTVLTSVDNVNLLTEGMRSKVFSVKPVGFNCTTPYTGAQLHYCGFTHDLAVSFAIQQGFKNVILLGAADFTKSHYDNTWDFTYSENLKRQSVYFLSAVCTKYCNLFTMNPNSVLNVLRITEREIFDYASKRER